MKKLVVLLLVLLSFSAANILVDGVDLANADVHYIKLEAGLGWGLKLYAFVDYGQDNRNRNRMAVLDENEKKRAFKSRIDILNTFYKNGWEINSVITVPKGGADSSAVSGYTYYLFERRDEE